MGVDITRHKLLGLAIGLYIVILLSLLNWGLPGKDRVFVYHMDEWHSLMAIKSIWQKGSNNVAGAANGSMGHFLLSGISLLPFMALKIIDVGVINSAVTGLMMQRRIFQLLRLNTLCFGVLSIGLIYLILKKHFRIKAEWGILMFSFTPVFLVFSNYFRYDIALVFWITLALGYMLNYGRNHKESIYRLAGAATGLALATKLTALPLLGLYLLNFFYYNKGKRKNFKVLFWGWGIFLLTFIFLGVPDLLLGKGDYSDLVGMVMTRVRQMSDFSPQMNWWRYLFLYRMPSAFGYGLSVSFIMSLGVLGLRKSAYRSRDLLFLLFGFSLFLLSILYLKESASWVRLLPLLPFMVIISGVAWGELKIKNKVFTRIVFLFLNLLVLIQLFNGLSRMRIKYQQDPRELASLWIERNLNMGSFIGFENIPIYQMVPDVLLKDYYEQKLGKVTQGKFGYKIVNSHSESLPEIVIVTNHDQVGFKFTSEKKDLMNRLIDNGYREEVSFKAKFSEANSIPSVISIFIKN